MTYDDWKCSPPCPVCSTPGCFCNDDSRDPDEEDEIDPRLDDAEVEA